MFVGRGLSVADAVIIERRSGRCRLWPDDLWLMEMLLPTQHRATSIPIYGLLGLVIGVGITAASAAGAQGPVSVERFAKNPLIVPDMDQRMGKNVEGPSLVKAPAWLAEKLGSFYLYFADHKGRYIRLATADAIAGPWSMYEPGTLTLERSHFLTQAPDAPETVSESASEGYATSARPGVFSAAQRSTIPHIASPDVHVRDDLEKIVMYYHGLESAAMQVTRVATSSDGIHFEAQEPILGRPYFRAFFYDGYWYALAMPGQFYRSNDGLNDFSAGPMRFNPKMRHSAVTVRGDVLWVFWTQAGDEPERILLSRVDLRGDWMQWQESEPVEVLRPELDWEGSELPLEPSVRGAVNVPVHQLRDPAIFVEGEQSYLLYAVKGESGIAGARLRFLDR